MSGDSKGVALRTLVETLRNSRAEVAVRRARFEEEEANAKRNIAELSTLIEQRVVLDTDADRMVKGEKLIVIDGFPFGLEWARAFDLAEKAILLGGGELVLMSIATYGRRLVMAPHGILPQDAACPFFMIGLTPAVRKRATARLTEEEIDDALYYLISRRLRFIRLGY